MPSSLDGGLVLLPEPGAYHILILRHGRPSLNEVVNVCLGGDRCVLPGGTVRLALPVEP
jgi:hypothetical protein